MRRFVRVDLMDAEYRHRSKWTSWKWAILGIGSVVLTVLIIVLTALAGIIEPDKPILPDLAPLKPMLRLPISGSDLSMACVYVLPPSDIAMDVDSTEAVDLTVSLCPNVNTNTPTVHTSRVQVGGTVEVVMDSTGPGNITPIANSKQSVDALAKALGRGK
jgi:hypothetical protein